MLGLDLNLDPSGKFFRRLFPKRFFTTLASAGSQHYTIPTVTLTGDFEIELDVYQSASATEILVGNALSNDDFIAVFADGTMQVKIGGVVAVSGVAGGTWTTNILHTVKVTKSGTTITLFLDGINVGSGSSSSSMVLGKVSGSGAGLEFNGIIANVRITDAGILVRQYRIDQDWVGPSTVLVDSSGNGQDGTAVNVTNSDALNYVFDGSVSPNTWTDIDTGLIVIEVAGT